MRRLVAVALLLSLLPGCARIGRTRAPDAYERAALVAAREVYEADCPRMDRAEVSEQDEQGLVSFCYRRVLACVMSVNKYPGAPLTPIIYVESTSEGKKRAALIAHEALHVLRACRLNDPDRFHEDTELWTSTEQAALLRWEELTRKQREEK